MTCKILIVDSDEMMRIFLRDVFWVHGGSATTYEVETAKSVAEANTYLEQNAKQCPTIIFLDISAPNIGKRGRVAGIEESLQFIRKVKEESPCKNKTSIVIFSSYDDPSIREKAKEAGASDFLVKGKYMPKEIVDFVEKHYVTRP